MQFLLEFKLNQEDNKTHYSDMLWHIIESQILTSITFSTMKLRHSWSCAIRAIKGSGFSGTTHNMKKFLNHSSPKSRVIDGRTINTLNQMDNCKFHSSKVIDNIVEYCKKK